MKNFNIMQFDDVYDKELFDRETFTKTSPENKTPALQQFKTALKKGHEHLVEQFESGNPIKEILYKRAWLIDQLLILIWQQQVSSADMALVAVGGYGRRELHPASDIDILILVPTRIKPVLKQQIETFLTYLWDIGLEVGHSVRSIKDCIRAAKTDITITTNLMESRLITGNEKLFQKMRTGTGPGKIWPSRKFFEAKWSEQITRHAKFDNTEHKLEPNIKEGPGGLRDIQTIDWVAKRHFGASRLRELVDHNFLSPTEYTILANGRDFLWRTRFALHIITGRHEDRLLFEHQRSVAKKFGYQADDNSGVEQFMKNYYQTVRELSRLNEMLLQHFQEEILYARRKEKIKPLNKRFQIRNDFIEVSNKTVFNRNPMALLEIFLLLQQTPVIKGVRASTIRLIRDSIHLINDDFRKDIRSKSLFMEIIRQPLRVGHELRRMHRYGVLAAYLPEFSAIEGLMQFDLFHVYTVDEHILFVVRNMRLFGTLEYADKFSLCHHLLSKIPKQELLYLAGIYHDIAKGRGGNHSQDGAKDALKFCRNHMLSEFDSKLVAWLVENHLLMSKTAQREDTNNPDTINNFAAKISDVMHLNYLYLLTVADINGTNPQLWNSWKDALLADLYEKTLLALRRGINNPLNKEELILERKQESRVIIGEKITAGRDIDSIWSNFGDDYFIRYSPDEIAWHTRALAKSNRQKFPLILIREMTDRGGTEIFIYMPDSDYIFSHTTKTFERLGLNILDARIITSNNGFTLDTFIVLEDSGEIVKGIDRKREIKTKLRQQLTSTEQMKKPETVHYKSRKLKYFPIPTRVTFTQDEKNRRTIMEVTASDRPGFLSVVGMALDFCGVRLQSAKIATYGERVEDIFFITDENNDLVTDSIKQECLQNTITEALTGK